MSSIATEDFKEITDLRNKLSTIVNEVGQFTLQIELLQSDIDELRKKVSGHSLTFKKLLDEEQSLVNRLSEKYGAGQINFETGEFTPEK